MRRKPDPELFCPVYYLLEYLIYYFTTFYNALNGSRKIS